MGRGQSTAQDAFTGVIGAKRGTDVGDPSRDEILSDLFSSSEETRKLELDRLLKYLRQVDLEDPTSLEEPLDVLAQAAKHVNNNDETQYLSKMTLDKVSEYVFRQWVDPLDKLEVAYSFDLTLSWRISFANKKQELLEGGPSLPELEERITALQLKIIAFLLGDLTKKNPLQTMQSVFGSYKNNKKEMNIVDLISGDSWQKLWLEVLQAKATPRECLDPQRIAKAFKGKIALNYP
jgi:hypothetical protein